MILHAMTKYGLLKMDDAVSTDLLTNVQATCELIFETLGSNDLDYHKCMDGVRFMLWVKHRLLPTFAACFPGKQMYLVLDNASYHCIRGPNWASPGAMTMVQCKEYLIANNILSITTARGSFDSALYGAKDTKTRPAPTSTELKDAVRQHLASNPQRTEMQKTMDEFGHILIYTPPCQPVTQPIELLWGTVKQEVKMLAGINRTLEEARLHTIASFDARTPQQCNAYIEHVHKQLFSIMVKDSEHNWGGHSSFQAFADARQ